MVRYFCSGADSQRDHRDAEQRLTHGTANQGSPGRAGQSIGRCWRPHAGRLCSSDQSRHRPLGADCEGIRIHALGLSRTRRLYIASEHRHGRRGDRMKRREFITLLGGAAAWPLAARAQQARKTHTIGFLSPSMAVFTPYRTVLFNTLRELGWIEGQNIAIERRYAENRLERLPELAAELVHLNVEVIVASGTLGPLAAKRATSTIPIVMTAAG